MAFYYCISKSITGSNHTFVLLTIIRSNIIELKLNKHEKQVKHIKMFGDFLKFPYQRSIIKIIQQLNKSQDLNKLC